MLLCEGNLGYLWSGKGRNKRLIGTARDSDPEDIFIKTDAGGAPNGEALDRSWFARCYSDALKSTPFALPETQDMAAFLHGCHQSSAPAMQLHQIGAQRYYTPIGWIGQGRDENEEEYGPEVGPIMLKNAKWWLKTIPPVMVRWGVTLEAMEELTRKCFLELASEERRQSYLGWDYGWAVRG